MKRPSEYTLRRCLKKEADGRYNQLSAVGRCFTEGDTFEDARRMAVDAMSLHLYGMEQDGETIPKANLELQAEGGLVVPITAWMTPFRDEMENRAVKKTLTIPAWLNDAAERHGVNYSQILQSALKDYLGVYHP